MAILAIWMVICLLILTILKMTKIAARIQVSFYGFNLGKIVNILLFFAKGQAIEVIGSHEESFNSSAEYYKPEPIASVYSASNNIAIPGLNPLPVPPVQSEYTSLARSTTSQYGNLLPPPNPPPAFERNGATAAGFYNPIDNDYHPGGSVENGLRPGSSNPSLLPPPPPMPQLNSSTEDFDSTWNMSMSWTSGLDTSALDTPVSPPHYERESLSSSSTLKYTENENQTEAQDVDHRQLPFLSLGAKLGLSKGMYYIYIYIYKRRSKYRSYCMKHNCFLAIYAIFLLNES